MGESQIASESFFLCKLYIIEQENEINCFVSLCHRLSSVNVEGQPGLQDLFYVWLFYFMCVDMYSLQIPLALLPVLCVLIMHYGDLSHSSTPPPPIVR